MARFRKLAVALVAIVLLVAGSAGQQPPTEDNNTDPQEIMRLLKAPISIEGLQEKRKLKDVLEVLNDRTQGRVPILVGPALRAETGAPDFVDPYEAEVSLPWAPKRVPLRTALRLILTQIAKDNVPASYIVRGDHVEIVPASHLSAKYRLRERVLMRFTTRPLEGALQDLADELALTIILDPSVGDKSLTPISANFRNVRAEDALVAVTEMAQLKYAVLEESIYVTTPSKAEAIEKDEKRRAERRQAPPTKPGEAK